MADAYLDWAYDQWLTKCHAANNVALPGNSWSPLVNPPAGTLTQPSGFQIANYSIYAVDLQLQSISQTTAPTGVQSTSAGDTIYNYLASVDVSMKTTVKAAPITVMARRVFQKVIQSPWQYAIFFNDDLEIHPSPKFTVNGWVHTNGSLYASPDGGNPLIFLDPRVEYSVPPPSPYQVVGYAPGDTRGTGTSHAGLAPGDTFAANPTAASRQDPFGISPSQFNATDTNPNNDGYRELLERPNTAFTDPFTSGTDQNNNPINPRYYSAADVKVLVDASNNVTVLLGTGAGTPITGAASDPNKAVYTAIMSTLTTGQTIEDWRENTASERLVTLDMGALKTAADGGKITGWNGVVYISDTSASSTAKRAVRVKNGSAVPTNGVTVVTDNPLYVQGDFNTATDASGKHQPTALVGDAINVLSNAWVDANSTSTTAPNATSTTVNAAFLAGIVPTDGSQGSKYYSGGVENFPRFHENWSGQTFTYNGSMVELFYSQQATGRWSDAKYSAPTRNWAFDTIFRTTPPPGSLMLTKYTRQVQYNHTNFQ